MLIGLVIFKGLIMYVFLFQFYLHMDGRGNYEFKKITEDTVEFGS